MNKQQIHAGWETDAKQLLQQLEQHWEADIHPDEVRRRVIELLLLIKRALARESADARFVMITYQRILKHQAGKEEQERANEALKRLLGELSVMVVSILPFAFVTLPGLFALAHHFGIELLPEDPTPEKSLKP